MEFAPELSKILLQILVIVLPALLTYTIGKRKRVADDKKAEADAIGSNLDNIAQEMGIYQKMMTDLKTTLEEVNVKYSKLEEQFTVLVKQERECQEERLRLQKENIDFYRKIQTCNHDCQFKK